MSYDRLCYLLENPLRVTTSINSTFGHYFGGATEVGGLPTGGRIQRILTLDPTDPLLSFLPFSDLRELPFLMDFGEGDICYSMTSGGGVTLHTAAISDSKPFFSQPFARTNVGLQRIPYEQYRAAIFAEAGLRLTTNFFTVEDTRLLEELGETFTQVAGAPIYGTHFGPYCRNPNCMGYDQSGISGTLTRPLVAISQQPAPGIDFEEFPCDPAIEFSLCLSCNSLSGAVIPD